MAEQNFCRQHRKVKTGSEVPNKDKLCNKCIIPNNRDRNCICRYKKMKKSVVPKGVSVDIIQMRRTRNQELPFV